MGPSLNRVAYANGQFVAVGADQQSNVILTSRDGVSWTPRYSDSDPRSPFLDVAYGNGQWLALRKFDDPGEFENAFVSSTDGVNWVSRKFDVPKSSDSLLSLAFGGNLWVSVGLRGLIFSSLDGINWIQQRAATTNNLTRVCYENGEWLAAEQEGSKISVSVNGMDWIAFDSLNIQTMNVNGFAFGNGKFVGVGDATVNYVFFDAILLSPDGLRWARSTYARNSLFDVCFAEGQFVAVGDGTILSSPDGITWSVRKSGAGYLRSVAYGNGKFVAVGFGSILLAEPPPPPPAALTLQSIRFSPVTGVQGMISGNPGQRYAIQASTNLLDWQLIAILPTSTNPAVPFSDSSATNLSRRFYRAVSP